MAFPSLITRTGPETAAAEPAGKANCVAAMSPVQVKSAGSSSVSSPLASARPASGGARRARSRPLASMATGEVSSNASRLAVAASVAAPDAAETSSVKGVAFRSATLALPLKLTAPPVRSKRGSSSGQCSPRSSPTSVALSSVRATAIWAAATPPNDRVPSPVKRSIVPSSFPTKPTELSSGPCSRLAISPSCGPAMLARPWSAPSRVHSSVMLAVSAGPDCGDRARRAKPAPLRGLAMAPPRA